MSVIFINPYRFGVALDPDAAAYIARVEGASGDNQALEQGVKTAINDFVVGCKADGIWNAIKASCIMAGARTLNGALQPLVGTAPTNNNFVSGDYNRKTGLVGDGSSKYLNSNRNNNADPQDSQHLAVFAAGSQSTGTGSAALCGAGAGTAGSTQAQPIAGAYRSRRGSGATATSISTWTNLLGVNRSQSATMQFRVNGVTTSSSLTSETPFNGNILIYGRTGSDGTSAGLLAATRIAFYSIGESLDLALLDARVTALINAYAAAIP